MNRPAWLEKANPSLPWKYPTVVDGVRIEAYNFNIHVGFPVDEVEKAMLWIDAQGAGA